MLSRIPALPLLGLAVALAAGCGGNGAAGPAASPATSGVDAARVATSEKGLFRVSYETAVTPPPLHSIHDWILTVTDADGNAVDGANVLIDGDMPEHQHGLPTKPEVTEALGDGRYRVEGMKFSMPGFWQVSVFVQAGGEYDTATFDLTLDPP